MNEAPPKNAPLDVETAPRIALEESSPNIATPPPPDAPPPDAPLAPPVAQPPAAAWSQGSGYVAPPPVDVGPLRRSDDPSVVVYDGQRQVPAKPAVKLSDGDVAILALMQATGCDEETARKLVAGAATGPRLAPIAGAAAAVAYVPADVKAIAAPPKVAATYSDKYPLVPPNGCRITHDLEPVSGIIIGMVEYPRGRAREVVAWLRYMANEWDRTLTWFEEQEKLRAQGQIP